MKRTRVLTIGVLMALCLSSGMSVAAAGPASDAAFSLESYLWAWLFPVGVMLVLVGISEGWSINDVAAMLPLALALAMVAEIISAFALYHGGAVLGAEWEPFGIGWGLLGLKGFLLSSEVAAGEAALPLLYDLPLLTVGVAIPLVVLRERGPIWLRYLVALGIGLLVYPVAGNWVAGGGWLQQLGETLGLGRGYVDEGRLSLLWVSTLASLGVLLALPRREPDADQAAPDLRPAYLPLHVLLGATLAWLGWLALVQRGESSPPGVLAYLWAISGATLLTALYGWLVRGSIEPGLIGRGLLGGIVAVGAVGPGVSALAAFGLGALAGLMLAPLIYLFDRALRLQEQSGLLAVFGGLTAASLLVPGLVGRWHGPGQLYAQLLGLAALGIWGGALPWALAVLVSYLASLPGRLAERAAQERLRLEAQAQNRPVEAEQAAMEAADTPEKTSSDGSGPPSAAEPSKGQDDALTEA